MPRQESKVQTMESLFILIPVALIFIAVAVKLFFWAVDNKQFDDLDSSAQNILFDDDPPGNPPPPKNSHEDTPDE